MAIYHLSAQVISRGYGHSAVHAAAYRARDDLTDERTGLRHDYSRKAGELLFEGIYAPKDAPEWAYDRAQLWNHVEAFEKHRRAELAREFNIALPHELTLEQACYAVQDWVRDNFTRKGLIADVTIHVPDKDGNERNMHAHVMVVMRKLDGSEFIRTKERFDTYSEKEAAKKAELEGVRESWARIGNRHLERHGFEPMLDHRTLKAQGIEREPTVHMGKSATAIEREGNPSELGDLNRAIIAENERRVIDLAAERAMREARTAAKGRTNEIRPDRCADIDRQAEQAMQDAHTATKGWVDDIRPDTASRDFSRADFEIEREQISALRDQQRADAAAAREDFAAEREDRHQAAETAREAHQFNREIGEAVDTGFKAGGGFLRGLSRVVEKFFESLSDFFSPPPPLTKDQAERVEMVAEEKQQARAEHAAEQEKAAAVDWAQFERNRQQQYDDFINGRVTPRESQRGHDDDDRDRGYERER